MNADDIRRTLRQLPDPLEFDHHYLGTYQTLRHLFGRLRLDNAEDLRAGACAVYAWMPTMLKTLPTDSQCADLQRLIGFRSAASAREYLTPNNTAVLRAVNNSVSGTSKLLHFARPDIFPIFDTNVARALGTRVTPERFVAFIGALYELGDRFDLPAWTPELAKLKPSWSSVRDVEFALFLIGKNLARNA